MMIIIKQVTNNLCDVFYGAQGWEPHEHVRMKRGQGTWIPVGKSLDYRYKLQLESILPTIQKVLHEKYSK